MDTGRWGCSDELVAVLSAAADMLASLPVSVSRLTGADLDAVLSVVDRLAAVAAAGRFTLAAEAEQQGLVMGSQAGSLRQWVTERCPALEAREAGTVAKAVRELSGPDLELARVAVGAGRLSVPAGCVVASELGQLRPLLEPGAEDAVLAGLVAIGEAEGCAGVRGVRPALLARYGLGQRLQDLDDRRAGMTVLSCGADIGGGITEYRMRLTPESRAVVEAAINVLSRPVTPTGDDATAATGARAGVGVANDGRTVDQRRGDALVEVCRHAAALTPALRTDDPAQMVGHARPSGVKATVLVTIGLDDLRDRTRPGVLVGGLDAGTILGPDTVRRLACDAGIIPVVLGTTGEILTLGRTRRLFTSAQLRALWLRDRHCTFPGCTVPATWADAHHLKHWADHGPTNLTNATLLCPRHHTIVHRDRLTAQLTTTHPTDTGVATTGTTVEWDRTPGSYDHTPTKRTPTNHPPPDG